MLDVPGMIFVDFFRKKAIYIILSRNDGSSLFYSILFYQYLIFALAG
jgi:hypothetical protein